MGEGKIKNEYGLGTSGGFLMTSPEELFDINRIDIDNLRKAIADLQAENNRLKRIFRLDEKESQQPEIDFREETQRNFAFIAQTLSDLSSSINRQDYVRSLNETETAMSFLGRQRTLQREKEIRDKMVRIEKLSTLTKKTIASCPIEEHDDHKGIAFKDPEDNRKTVETMCPISWWISMSQLRFYKGDLSKFHEEHPLTKYMETFRK